MKLGSPLLMIALGFISACATTVQTPAPNLGGHDTVISVDSDLFGPRPEIVQVADIYRLSGEQQDAFLEYFNDPLRRHKPMHRRVAEYLEKVTSDFTYDGDTYTASTALQMASGNCLSLAILTTALANLVGVETGYQLVDSAPVYQSEGEIIYKGLHVRTMLFDPEWQRADLGVITLRRPGVLVDYFPSDGDRFISNISDAEYQAMYYNNLAGDALARQDYNLAYWLSRKSLELSPQNTSAVNSMAIVFRHAGELAKAEEIYLWGIENLPDKVSLLRNYRVLLKQQERFAEADIIDERLAGLNDLNPFDWLEAGQVAYDDGEFKEAVDFFKKAVEIAPYLHESYAAMAKAYYRMGNKRKAERELKNAQEHSTGESTRTLYEAKLTALQKEG